MSYEVPLQRQCYTLMFICMYVCMNTCVCVCVCVFREIAALTCCGSSFY